MLQKMARSVPIVIEGLDEALQVGHLGDHVMDAAADVDRARARLHKPSPL